MKTVKSIITSLILILMVSGSLMAQSTPKVIGVINKADWCSVCENNGARAMAAFMANNKDGEIAFVANDLTNDDTKKKSSEALKKYGLEDAVSSLKSTGMAYFFDSESKALINKVSVAKSDKELAEAMSEAVTAVK